jgi:hypothetical protein
MIKTWRVVLHAGTTIYNLNVQARSHEEAYEMAILSLHLKHANVGNATITPTLRTA